MIRLSKNSKNNLLHIQIVTFLLHWMPPPIKNGINADNSPIFIANQYSVCYMK